MNQLARPQRGWIKAIREGLGMTSAQLATRMGIRQPSVAELEKSEAEKRITLASLERVAEALDCRLVYMLVPNQPLSERLTKRANEMAEEQLAAVNQTMKLEKQSVANVRQRETLKSRIIQTLLDTGKPWQNGTTESFNGKFRDECLSLEWFRSRDEAKVLIETWRRHFNEVRPHSSLGYMTPNEFVASIITNAAPVTATERTAAVCGASALRSVAQSLLRGQTQKAELAAYSK